MRSLNYLLVVGVILTSLTMEVSAQRSTKEPTLATESIVGSWELQKVYAGSREIARNPNAESPASLEFRPDGTYEQQSSVNDNGSFRFNEDQSILYLESASRKESTSATTVNSLNEYEISIKDGILTMQSRGNDSASTKYVYIKKDNNENSSQN